MYDLPQFNTSRFRKNLSEVFNNKTFQIILLVIIIVIAGSFATGNISPGQVKGKFNSIVWQLENLFPQKPQEKITPEKPEEKYISKIPYEQAIIDSVQSASPSVVSIIISKNVPVYEEELMNIFGEDLPGFEFQVPQRVQKGTKYQEIGAGSGFIVSQDGLVVTNRHVVLDKAADYTVVTNDGKKYSAKVLALDPVQDLAIIKIQSDPSNSSGQVIKFSAIKLGDSNGIQIGQGAIAIGNALGQFSNTVSVGVVSGLKRTVNASNESGSFSETLEGIIQTDAAINFGNSGGPLINLRGEVIGVNTATAQGAQTVGFAIPINIAKRDIQQIIATNKITYAFLGVRYVLVDDLVKKEKKLSIDYGALVISGKNGELPVIADSPAQKAGLKAKDVILEINSEKITKDNSMTKILAKYSPNDKITLKVLRDDKEISVDIILAERN